MPTARAHGQRHKPKNARLPAQRAIWPQRRFWGATARGGTILRAALRTVGRQLRSGLAETPARRPPPADPVAAAIVGCAAVVRAIGRPEFARTAEAVAWVEIDRTGPVPLARLHFRGAMIRGPAVTRRLNAATGRVERMEAHGSARYFCFENLVEAAHAARAAIAGAGIRLAPMFEIFRTPAGGHAVIGFRELSAARGRGPIMAR